jgi:putative ABC transport system permease protein
MNILWMLELFRDGLRNLSRHLLRSVLTLLGIVFGTAAVIAMMGIGEGAQQTVLAEISAQGLRNIAVDSVEPSASSAPKASSGNLMLQYGITRRDMTQIQAACPTAQVTPLHAVRQKVLGGNRPIEARVLGVEPVYFDRIRALCVSGRLLAIPDNEDRHAVAILSTEMAETLRRKGHVKADTLEIGNQMFRIVGVARIPGKEAANVVLIPYRTATSLFGSILMRRESGKLEMTRVDIGQLLITTASEEEVPAVAAVVRRTLELNHTRGDYAITVPLDLLRAKQRSRRALNFALVSIASISLLVGGIGIMNIMLAIVTERIPEIGLRRAIGARRRDILMQFLAETVTLSTLGGLAGCLLGWAAVRIATQWTDWPGIITAQSVVLSMGVAWITGLVFGLAPAIRAARLDPVIALRSE